MQAEQVRAYFLSRPETIEDFPFGAGPRMLKSKGKMYGFIWKKQNLKRINLKCASIRGNDASGSFWSLRSRLAHE